MKNFDDSMDLCVCVRKSESVSLSGLTVRELTAKQNRFSLSRKRSCSYTRHVTFEKPDRLLICDRMHGVRYYNWAIIFRFAPVLEILFLDNRMVTFTDHVCLYHCCFYLPAHSGYVVSLKRDKENSFIHIEGTSCRSLEFVTELKIYPSSKRVGEIIIEENV